MSDTISGVLTANGLIVAFVVVGVLVWFSYFLSNRLTRGRIHGSAIAIAIGLALAYVGGAATGGSRGLADVSLLAGLGLMGGAMLRDRIAQAGATCWLVNTGWTGGAYGTGRRMPIAATRALLAAALDGSLARARFRKDPVFGFEVPTDVPGVDPGLLDPRGTWADPAAYDAQAAKLAAMFATNFAQYEEHVSDDVRAAAIRAA